MFPDFMQDMVNLMECGHCDAPQTIADIRVVGIRRPEEFEAFRGEPVFIIITGCPQCGQWTNHTMRRSRAQSIAGCNSFIDLIEKECKGKKPPINIPGLGKKSARSSAGESESSQRPRPSRRLNQPQTPPTQQEIQQFLGRLRRTSFKRSSKGFTNWMKELGSDEE